MRHKNGLGASIPGHFIGNKIIKIFFTLLRSDKLKFTFAVSVIYRITLKESFEILILDLIE